MLRGMNVPLPIPPHVRRHSIAGFAIAIVALLVTSGIAPKAALQMVTVSGQVTSSTTSLGLQGTVVQFFDLNAQDADGPAVEATTDASGNYIANVPPGSYGVLTR